MHLRKILAAAAAVGIATVGLTVLTPSPASAGALVSCGTLGYSAATHLYTFECDLLNANASNEYWYGIQADPASNGTAHAVGKCIAVPETHPYRPFVTYLDNSTGLTVTTTSVAFYCNGQAGY